MLSIGNGLLNGATGQLLIGGGDKLLTLFEGAIWKTIMLILPELIYTFTLHKWPEKWINI